VRAASETSTATSITRGRNPPRRGNQLSLRNGHGTDRPGVRARGGWFRAVGDQAAPALRFGGCGAFWRQRAVGRASPPTAAATGLSRDKQLVVQAFDGRR